MTLTRTHRRAQPSLVSRVPTASAPANVVIGHVQLRDLVVCPVERGVLWYVGDRSIIEQDIIAPLSRQRALALLTFTPVTLAALALPSSSSGKQRILLAAGGQDAEIFLALYSYTPRRTRNAKHKLGSNDSQLSDENENEEEDLGGYSTPIWQHASSLVGSINNSVLLYLPPPDPEHILDNLDADISRTSPRLVVSNNDCTVKFFDVCLARSGLRRTPASHSQTRVMDTRYWRHSPVTGREGPGVWGEGWGVRGSERVVRYERVGCLRLPVPVNHTSISPDGSTLLSCGDASTIYLHRILSTRNGSTFLFEPLGQYDMPLPSPSTPSSSATSSYPPSLSQAYTLPHAPLLASYLPFAFVDGAWVVSSPSFGRGGLPACFATAWSADGMKFAAASQEGVVRVWDVRSGKPLAGTGWETGSVQTHLGAGRTSADLHFDQASAAPPWGVRALKFAKNASGRELLVFTEHESLLHVIDADTFETHDIVRVPHVTPNAEYYSSRQNSAHPISSHSDPYPDPFPDPGLYLDASGSSRYPLTSSEINRSDRGSAGEDIRVNRRAHAFAHSHSFPPQMIAARNLHQSRAPQRRYAHLPPLPAYSSPTSRVDRTPRVELNEDIVVDAETLVDADMDARVAFPRMLSPSRPFTRSPEGMVAALPAPSPSPRASEPSGSSSASARDQDLQAESEFSARASRRHREMVLTRRQARIREMEEDIAYYAARESGAGEDSSAVVIPPLLNAQSEEEIRNVLAAHGIASVASVPDPASSTESSRALAAQEALRAVGDYAMDIDSDADVAEAPSELDCLLPPVDPESAERDSPSITEPPSTRSDFGSSIDGSEEPASPISPSSETSSHLTMVSNSVSTLSSSASSTIQSVPSPPDASPPPRTLPPCSDLIESTERLDIVGVSFDPTGAYMYVATVDGLVEFAVQGTDQRWWTRGGWM